MICFVILCIFTPFKKFKGWLQAGMAEFKGQHLKVKPQKVFSTHMKTLHIITHIG